MVGGDVGRWGPCGLTHTRAMRGAHAGDAWRGGRVRVGPPAGAHRVGGQALCGSGAWRAPLLTRAFSFHRPLREQGRAWTVEEGRQRTLNGTEVLHVRKKRALSSPSLIETNSHPGLAFFLGRALPPLRERLVPEEKKVSERELE